jgi:GMP synthase-like glutamine amidotransferase
MSRVHCIEHVPFETPGRIADWVVERGHSFAGTRVYEKEPFPSLDAFDCLVVMGGPMGVHDDARYDWLQDEKRVIDAAIHAEKRVLGVCLGAQLVAHVLGARVHRNRFKEIGWFPVHSTEAARAPWGLPKEFAAFHWHSDAFDLPKDAVHLARSAACENQMFAIGTSIVGIQFHPEMTRTGIAELIRHAAADLGEGPYVQSPSAMAGADRDFVGAHTLLDAILDRWSA